MMSRAGHLFSRAPLSRVGDRLAQNIGHELQPKDVQNAQGCGGQTITLWEEVGRGGEGQCKVENQEDRSYYPKEEVSGP